MSGVFLGLGLLVAVLAATAKARRAEAAPASANDARAEAAAHIKRIVDSGDPAKIAAAAAVAAQAGQAPLAQQLQRDAKNAAAAHPDTNFPSPWTNLPREKWNQYLAVMRGKDAKAITPGYHLGLWGFGMRRLVDLGLATNPRKGLWKGKKVWMADWISPLSTDVFLGDADLQYQALVKATDQDIARIKADYPELVGSTVDGQKVTYSGLLAVVKQAGFEGLHEWASDAKVRSEHPNTTAIFRRANGIF